MYRQKSICIVIPAYNEEKQIGHVIARLPEWVDFIVVVNDKSTDRTSQVVQRLKEIDTRIVLIEHEANAGCGGALASGYKWADSCREKRNRVASSKTLKKLPPAHKYSSFLTL